MGVEVGGARGEPGFCANGFKPWKMITITQLKAGTLRE